MQKKDKYGFPIPDDDPFLNPDTIASATECTGLIPTPPLSDDEVESYGDIYRIPKPEDRYNDAKPI